MANKKQSRQTFIYGTAGLLLAALVYAFWPDAVLVDMATVHQGEFQVTVDEEARTQVHDAYVVSAPISGRLLRVNMEAGDPVRQGQSVVAQMLPASPPALDRREAERARSAVKASEAALRAASADAKRTASELVLAETTLKRVRTRREAGTASDAELDRAINDAESARAADENAMALIAVREAESANARAAFIGLDAADTPMGEPIAIKAPIDGRILRVWQKSEVVLPAGTPILEIGNVENDLEIAVELLSTDAVKVSPGDSVRIENWGGDEPLAGKVIRVEPLGFTKVSALGVEEQRVNVTIAFADRSANETTLGHGFRVEVRIIIWQANDAVIVPASALFRHEGEWAVFQVEDGTARRRIVTLRENNGTDAAIAQGLAPGDEVILYPASELTDGTNVARR